VDAFVNLDELEKIARAATPGPWTVNGDHFPVCTLGNSNEDGKDYSVAGNGYAIRDGAHSDAKDDAQYIATFSPARVLRLLDIVRKADEMREYMNELAEASPLPTRSKLLVSRFDKAREGLK
jgi:hypothetical protein